MFEIKRTHHFYTKNVTSLSLKSSSCLKLQSVSGNVLWIPFQLSIQIDTITSCNYSLVYLYNVNIRLTLEQTILAIAAPGPNLVTISIVNSKLVLTFYSKGIKMIKITVTVNVLPQLCISLSFTIDLAGK